MYFASFEKSDQGLTSRCWHHNRFKLKFIFLGLEDILQVFHK